MGTALALVACAWTAPAVQAQAPCVGGCVVLTVSGTSGAAYVRTLPLSQILSVSDRGSTSYTVRSADGSDRVYDAPGADQTTSVRQVLVRILHVAPGPDTTVAIQRPDGGVTTLRGADLDQAGQPGYPFADGPPVFTSLGKDNQVTFIRPQRNDTDVNQPDVLIANQLTGAVQTGAGILAPTVAADPPTTAKNTNVTFTATDGGATGQVTYFWESGDGRSTTTGNPTTTFSWSSSGSYDVSVTVQATNGTGVATKTVTVKGATEPGPSKPGGGGTNKGGPSTGAPGTGNQSGAAPGAGGTGRGGAGTKGTGTRGKTGTGDSTGTTQTSPPPATTGSTSASRRALRQAQSKSDGKATPRRTPTASNQVTGVLLDSSAAAALTPPSGSSARVASATTRPATDIPADRRWLLAAVPLALLLLGGARQTRWLTRRLPELPWRTS